MQAKSPSETITDKLCRLAVERLWSRLEKEYDRLFPHVGAGTDFLAYMEKWWEKILERLAKRPITRAEVNALEIEAYRAIRGKMLKIAESIQQPKFQEAVRIETGEVWQVPRP